MHVVFLIPTRNEAAGIGKTIDSVRKAAARAGIGKADVLVVDGHSTDRTVAIAKSKGARVIIQKDRGKGAALIEAIATIPGDNVVVMTDADSTYSLAPLGRMLGLADDRTIVQGKRVITRGSMTVLNRCGNIFFNGLATLAFGRFSRDILSGFRVFKAKTFRSLKLESKGFDIEAEMTIKATKRGYRVIEVPSEYTERAGETSLHPFKDGLLILKRIIREI